MDGVTLGRAIDYLRDVSGANIVVNWKVLEGVGVAKDTVITLQVRDLTLRKMLQLVLDQASPNAELVTSVDSNVIQVTTQEDADKQVITKVYIVDDLVMAPIVRQAPSLSLGTSTSTTINSGSGGAQGSSGMNTGGNTGSNGSSGGGIFGNNNSSNQNQQTQQKTSQQRGDDLVTLIKEVVRPTIWRDNGGTASIKYFDGKLIVTAPISVQEAIGGPVGDAGVRYGS